jgi:hypothetical protein
MKIPAIRDFKNHLMLFAMNDALTLEEELPSNYPRSYWDCGITDTASKNEPEKVLCPACGKNLTNPRWFPTHVWKVGRNVGLWPDVLRNLGGDGFVAVTEKVVEDFRREGLTGYSLHPLDFSDIMKKNRPPMPYYVVMCKGHAMNVYYYQGVKLPRCGACRLQIVPKLSWTESLLLDIRLDEDSWDGQDFVLLKSARYGTCGIGCSPRVIDAARKYQWTGALFLPIVPLIGWGVESIVVDHHAKNWRELLDYDIRLLNAERNLVDVSENYWEERRKKLLELRRAGIPLLPDSRPTPVYDPDYPPPEPPPPPHPFDGLGDFDGCGWQAGSELHCDLVCGEGDLYVIAAAGSPMVRKWLEGGDDSVRPSKKTREAFDFIVAHEKQVLPEVKRIVREQLRRLRPDLELPAPEAGMAALRDFFDGSGGDLSLWDPVRRGKGDAQLGFTLPGDPPRDGFSIWLHFDLNAGTLAVKEVEEK